MHLNNELSHACFSCVVAISKFLICNDFVFGPELVIERER